MLMLTINSLRIYDELVALFIFFGTGSVVAPDVAVFKMLISHTGVYSFSLSVRAQSNCQHHLTNSNE